MARRAWQHPSARHEAGDTLGQAANKLFRRSTDDVVAERVGKRPLDVGADRIARTAHAALGFLNRLREKAELPIPLAWEPTKVGGAEAIEVYPAATLKARGLVDRGYKGATQNALGARRSLVSELRKELRLQDSDQAALEESDHVLDSVVCTLAALDFAKGEVVRPTDLTRARKEGWIWFRPSSWEPERVEGPHSTALRQPAG